jgi:hypothetical protein
MEAIGGYFGIELPPAHGIPFEGAVRLQSARACLAALIAVRRPNRIWMPRYICGSMLAPLERAAIPIAWYRLDDQLGVESEVQLEPGDLILVVNYFGVCGRNEDSAVTRFGPDRVILDRAQAFFASARESLATIYSPRKFFGVPDGGLMLTRVPIAPPDERDPDSIRRSAHLLARHDGDPRRGYAAFREAEESLEDVRPLAMSGLTQRILESVDYEAVRARRNANFRFLHQRLGSHNVFPIEIGAVDGPLCYPFLTRRPGVRELLIRNNVFVPRYWQDAADRVDADAFEHRLVHECHAIPCDQRYGERELARVVDLLSTNIPTEPAI